MSTQIKIRIIDKAGNRVAGARVAVFDGDTEIRSFVPADGESSFEPDSRYAAHLLRVRVSKGKSTQEKMCRLEGEFVALTFEMEEEREHAPPPPPPPPLMKRLLIPASVVFVGVIVWLLWSLIQRPVDIPTAMFGASPDTIPSGGTSELAWEVNDVETVEISQEIGTVKASGKRTVTPSQTTTYTLQATNAAGNVTAEVTVHVEPTPVELSIISFTAGPTRILRGKSSLLRWAVQGAETVEISPTLGSVSLSGKTSVAPTRNTTYRLVARNKTSEVAKEVTVRVPQSDTLELASPHSPAILIAGRDTIHVVLKYDLLQAGTLDVIPLDVNQRRVENVRYATLWGRAQIGSSNSMPVGADSGSAFVQITAMQPAEVKYLRLRVVRGANVPLLKDVEVNYRFVR